jgi:hypothetical protein
VVAHPVAERAQAGGQQAAVLVQAEVHLLRARQRTSDSGSAITLGAGFRPKRVAANVAG